MRGFMTVSKNLECSFTIKGFEAQHLKGGGYLLVKGDTEFYLKIHQVSKVRLGWCLMYAEAFTPIKVEQGVCVDKESLSRQINEAFFRFTHDWTEKPKMEPPPRPHPFQSLVIRDPRTGEPA